MNILEAVKLHSKGYIVVNNEGLEITENTRFSLEDLRDTSWYVVRSPNNMGFNEAFAQMVTYGGKYLTRSDWGDGVLEFTGGVWVYRSSKDRMEFSFSSDDINAIDWGFMR